jgi:hypothetical protein
MLEQALTEVCYVTAMRSVDLLDERNLNAHIKRFARLFVERLESRCLPTQPYLYMDPWPATIADFSDTAVVGSFQLNAAINATSAPTLFFPAPGAKRRRPPCNKLSLLHLLRWGCYAPNSRIRLFLLRG